MTRRRKVTIEEQIESTEIETAVKEITRRAPPRVVHRTGGYSKMVRGEKSPKAYTKVTEDDVNVLIKRGWRVRSRAHGVRILPA